MTTSNSSDSQINSSTWGFKLINSTQSIYWYKKECVTIPNDDFFYFEISLSDIETNDFDSVAIGLYDGDINSDFSPTLPIGDAPQSFSFWQASHQFYAKGSTLANLSQPEGFAISDKCENLAPIALGDSIGCGYYKPFGMIFFTKNGKSVTEHNQAAFYNVQFKNGIIPACSVTNKKIKFHDIQMNDTKEKSSTIISIFNDLIGPNALKANSENESRENIASVDAENGISTFPLFPLRSSTQLRYFEFCCQSTDCPTSVEEGSLTELCFDAIFMLSWTEKDDLNQSLNPISTREMTKLSFISELTSKNKNSVIYDLASGDIYRSTIIKKGLRPSLNNRVGMFFDPLSLSCGFLSEANPSINAVHHLISPDWFMELQHNNEDSSYYTDRLNYYLTIFVNPTFSDQNNVHITKLQNIEVHFNDFRYTLPEYLLNLQLYGIQDRIRDCYNETHERVICDGCNQTPLRGIRSKCAQCNFDFCSNCLISKVHVADHHFRTIYRAIPFKEGENRIAEATKPTNEVDITLTRVLNNNNLPQIEQSLDNMFSYLLCLQQHSNLISNAAASTALNLPDLREFFGFDDDNSSSILVHHLLPQLPNIPANAEWNNRYQSLFEEKVSTRREADCRNRRLRELIESFVQFSEAVAMVLVYDCMDDNANTLLKCNSSGVAGGKTFQYGNIVFKFPDQGYQRFIVDTHFLDSSNTPSIPVQVMDIPLYSRLEHAEKAAHHEIKTINALVQHHSLYPMFHTTLTSLFRIGGIIVMATALAPISPCSLVYGSDGKHCRANPEVHRELTILSDVFHLQSHKTQVADLNKPHSQYSLELYTAADVAIHHSSTDGRLYIVDLHRFFPPLPPDRNDSSSHLCARFRPEFIQQYCSNRFFNSDTFSLFHEQNTKVNQAHEAAIYAALKVLIVEAIPAVAKELHETMLRFNQMKLPLKKIIDEVPINKLFHKVGINLKFLSHVHKHTTSAELKDYLFIEMLARILKDFLRQALRKCGISSLSSNSHSHENVFNIKLARESAIISRMLQLLFQNFSVQDAEESNTKNVQFWHYLNNLGKRKYEYWDEDQMNSFQIHVRQLNPNNPTSIFDLFPIVLTSAIGLTELDSHDIVSRLYEFIHANCTDSKSGRKFLWRLKCQVKTVIIPNFPTAEEAEKDMWNLIAIKEKDLGNENSELLPSLWCLLRALVRWSKDDILKNLQTRFEKCDLVIAKIMKLNGISSSIRDQCDLFQAIASVLLRAGDFDRAIQFIPKFCYLPKLKIVSD